MYRPGQLPGRASVISGVLQAGGTSIFLCLTGEGIPQKATLDILCTFLWFVSYRHPSPKFQSSLSAVPLALHLCGHPVTSYLDHIRTVTCHSAAFFCVLQTVGVNKYEQWTVIFQSPAICKNSWSLIVKSRTVLIIPEKERISGFLLYYDPPLLPFDWV